MFVYTAKLNRKKAIITLAVLALALISIILIAGRGDRASMKTNEDRVAYLTGLGWEITGSAVEEQSIVIPEDVGTALPDYVALQKSQGFNIEKFAGLEATRYTYEVKNFPGCSDTVYADLIVCRNKVIAGDVQSAAIDGFMQGLAFPG